MNENPFAVLYPKDCLAEVSGTLSASVGAVQTSYPTGFDSTNSYVIGFVVNEQFVRFTDDTSVYFTAGAINVYNSISAWFSKPYRVLLARLS